MVAPDWLVALLARNRFWDFDWLGVFFPHCLDGVGYPPGGFCVLFSLSLRLGGGSRAGWDFLLVRAYWLLDLSPIH